MELKDILEQLSTFGNDQPVPREALAEAVRHKEEITPVLLDSLDTLYEKVQTEGEAVSWNVGRNDPCPCGSGKKFKKCCLPKKEEWEFRFNSEHSWEINRDRYPPVERQENRPGLLDFYDADAIEVDRLAYRAMLMLDHPNFQQKRESRKTHAEARKLLLEAFEKFRQICEAKGLKTSDEYDRDHKLHYYSREWLRVLCDLLADAGDERYHAVHAML